ncbi:MAG: NADH-quinone oxidoreductase subunit N [Bryobacteraceae bacterium]
MTSIDALALLPLIITMGTSILVMLAIAIHRSHAWVVALTVAGLAVAFISLFAAAGVIPHQPTPLLIVDSYALFYMGLILASAGAVALLSYKYFAAHEGDPEELYLLLLVATLGCETLVASAHFASFFLGLEILSVSLYGMIAYLTDRKQPLEAGIKYLILAAASSAFLLFGMALVYADLGTMEIGQIAARGMAAPYSALTLTGMALIITGIGFKLALVPFHLWTPDVYQGAPAPVTAFIATASKSSMFALLLRYFHGSPLHGAMFTIFTIIAIASMLAGNLLALLQSNVKRILAYSSIAHLGYTLVAFLAGGEAGAEAVTFYLVAYTVTTLGAFGVIAALSPSERDADRIEDYQGLFWRKPWSAAIFTGMLFSLAGIPATAGFIGKFYVVAAGAAATIWALIVILVVTSAIGLYYYLRIVVALYSAAPEEAAPIARAPAASGFVLGVLALLLVWLGVYPQPMIQMIRNAAAALGLS